MVIANFRLRLFFANWLLRRLPGGISARSFVFGWQEIFILPTGHGFLFGVILLLMLTGSVNYDLSLGLVLTFLLGAMGVVSIFHTYRNLARLRISVRRNPPVFAGGQAIFTLKVENAENLPRYNVTIHCGRQTSAPFDVPALGAVDIQLAVPAPRRGVLKPGRCKLGTRFPLGLFKAWAYLIPDSYCLIYPNPECEIRRPLPRAEAGDSIAGASGNDDFAGLRSYQRGDALRHVAWKAVARGHPLMTKQFDGNADLSIWLDWDELPASMDTEARLSRLARWVLDAGSGQKSFGLRLPGQTVPPATGAVQQQRCLSALARFGL